ncbi:MAG: RNA polymerase subunit sigma-24 [Candidatus Nephthysia bennettiae]|uniref:Sigma-70 family RNA polymerase sigma factor n=1 Tax=Candidatus Nephthysia bennettiae TaxID=3127016 RepID=A0A934KAD8_9BACT|nr:sigma-70 family RNA polymerase sigma factor [Candidatus Dormibacteraeota bacterium]PZR94224.1 MAG: RNA polymerase subunit sigma-24 [Candidatus Dormibacteraeota bacterium]
MGGTEKEFSDPEMVSGLAAGEVEVLRTLYQRYGTLAYSLAVRMLGDHGRAEDVVQDAFIKVWTSAGSFDPNRGTLRTWLLTTVRHRAIDYLRGRPGRERKELELSLELPSHGAGSDPWRDVSESLERQAIRQALGSLPADQRQVVELAYYGGYTQREIAEVVQVPLGTIKGRTRLAMEKLSSYLQGRGLIDDG